jgi:hypothetical protein
MWLNTGNPVAAMVMGIADIHGELTHGHYTKCLESIYSFDAFKTLRWKVLFLLNRRLR